MAGVSVSIDLLYEDYLRLYRPYFTELPPALSLRLSNEEVLSAQRLYTECPQLPYVEHMELCTRLSNLLLPMDRVVFHGMAFAWQGKAWLLTAPSGTGKSTQYFLWKLLYRDEVAIICGDKPILERRTDGFILHSSPWNGKENMGTVLSLPLGGIVYLEQAAENSIERVSTGMALPIYSQLIYSPMDAETILAACGFADALLRSVPLWRLRNRGDRASAKLCHDTLKEAVSCAIV